MNSLQHHQIVDDVLSPADDHALWLLCGWALPIIERVEKYRIAAKYGFLQHEEINMPSSSK